MTAFSRTMIDRSGYGSDGFAAVYDQYRPRPPAALLDILTLLAQAPRPRLVVDIGSGTGLSARAWAGRAERVVAVEPNPSMIEQAIRAGGHGITYLRAFADRAPLADGCADIVTAAQSFHWMEPRPALAEAARLLRPGGVFAAYDYDLPPVVHPEVDDAFAAHFAARASARERLGLQAGAAYWPKARHLEQIRESGRFRFAREVVCHGAGRTDAAGIVGLAESAGGPRGVFGGDAPEVDATLERLREVAWSLLGEASRPMVLCYRVRVGVR